MKKYLLYALAVPFASCTVQSPVTTEPAHNNKQYVVDYLFEHDGCKVYRFQDNGHYVYFTNCRGEAITKTDSATVTRNTTNIKKD
jgi:hypothetical protein